MNEIPVSNRLLFASEVVKKNSGLKRKPMSSKYRHLSVTVRLANAVRRSLSAD